MPITKRIVELMGGTIDVQSAPDKGTEFVIRLPLPFAPDAAPEDTAQDVADATEAAPPLDFSRMRILLVEDNDINREIAHEVLARAGFAVDQATNGQAAVEKVSRGGPGFYDAILMDVHMPVMDGLAAARTIRAMALPGMRRIPIVALSANAFETDVKAALAAGMDAHIAKPIRIPLLLKTLERLMRARPADGASPDAPPPPSPVAADLHICRMLARAMGGDLEIKSVLGQGATFTVTIPGVKTADIPPPSPPSAPAAANAVPPHRTCRILIVDDTKMNQIVLRAMFGKLGVTDLTFADNGREALDILTSPSSPRFDLVLTDAWMPEMTGMDLVSAIRANPSLSPLPVYLFTAEVEMKDTYSTLGFNGILLKPADLEALAKILP